MELRSCETIGIASDTVLVEGEAPGIGVEFDRRVPHLGVTGHGRLVGNLVAHVDDVLVDHGGVGDDQLAALVGQVEFQHGGGLAVGSNGRNGHVGERHIRFRAIRGSNNGLEVLVDRQALGCHVLHEVRILVVAFGRVRNIQRDGVGDGLPNAHAFSGGNRIGRLARLVGLVLVLGHKHADSVDLALAGCRIALHFECGGHAVQRGGDDGIGSPTAVLVHIGDEIPAFFKRTDGSRTAVACNGFVGNDAIANRQRGRECAEPCGVVIAGLGCGERGRIAVIFGGHADNGVHVVVGGGHRVGHRSHPIGVGVDLHGVTVHRQRGELVRGVGVPLLRMPHFDRCAAGRVRSGGAERHTAQQRCRRGDYCTKPSRLHDERPLFLGLVGLVTAADWLVLWEVSYIVLLFSCD